jgi:hypothetical protein
LADDEQPTGNASRPRFSLAEIRSLPHYVWESWPFDEYDQGNPVVEIRQADLHGLVDAAKNASAAIARYLNDGNVTNLIEARRLLSGEGGAGLEEKARLVGGPSNPVH